MPKILRSVWCSALLSLAAAAMGQDEANLPQDDVRIVIEGERIDKSQMRDLLGRITPALAPDLPLDRLIDPLCLAISGPGQRQGQALVDLIERRVQSVGVEIAASGCRPNALVIFHHDLGGLLDRLIASQPGLFADTSRARLEQQLASDPLTLVWSSREDRTEDGRPLLGTSTLNGSTGTLPFYAKTNQQASARRVGLSVSSSIENITILLDPSPLDGVTVGTLADYLALRLLAPGLLPAALQEGDPRSVLTLFDAPQSAPGSWSPFDEAYVKALYTLPLNAETRRLRGAIMKQLASAAE